MKLVFRLRQAILRGASYCVPWHFPTIIDDNNVYANILTYLKKDSSTLIITDETIKNLGLLDELVESLQKSNYSYSVYSKVKPNPTIENVEGALLQYYENNCSRIIAFGGGSPMDCAKAVAARIAKPKKSLKQLAGLLKVNKKLIPIIAIPTTAGTGSETTIAAVITDEETHTKHVITDICLTPCYVALIPELTKSLPPFITAPTGIDALSHAIEAYIGNANTRQTKKDALHAIKLIKENLLPAYENSENMVARKNMLEASFLAGRSFSRAYVGYVHALSHAVGGLYNIPHGKAIAIIMPYVLREYGRAIHKKLARISDVLELTPATSTNEQKAEAVIQWIEELNSAMGIGKHIKNIEDKDIDLLTSRACKEANPLYPVPVIWKKEQFIRVIKTIGDK
ncbi:MAG: iron-containing alcohol dehydrogenase [Spirochaetales bacterium]